MKELSISFIVPVIDEATALHTTVETIFNLAGETVREVLIVAAECTTPASWHIIDELVSKHQGRVWVHRQGLPGIGGAFREAFGLARGQYIMLMASDLETDPKLIPDFIKRMERGDCDVVVASRWLTGGGFEGYGLIKVVLNWGFQRIFRVLYGVKLTDLTFAYRLHRRETLEGIEWEETKHPFLLECLLKPLRLGYKIVEIPCGWKKRTEGESHGSVWQMFKYVSLAVRVRFMNIKRYE